MAKLIPGVKLTAAKNAQFDEYMRDVLENARVCPGIQTYLPGDLAAFRSASDALHAMVARPLRWALTPEITEADQKLDKALSALRALMKASIENPDAEAAAAAKVVLRMSEIDKISGSEQYDEETGKITAMITTLLGEYAEQTQAAGLMPFVLQLKERNERLCQLIQERDLAQGEAGPHNTTELRTITDEVYRKLVLDVNSVANCIDLGLITPSEPQPFAIFIDYMIGHIDRFHREVLHTSASSTPGMDTGGDDSGSSAPGGSGSGGTGSGDNNTGGGNDNTGSGSNENGSGGGNDNTGSGDGQKYTIAWYDTNGQPLAYYHLPVGATVPEAPAPPAGYRWPSYPTTMPARDVDVMPVAISG